MLKILLSLVVLLGSSSLYAKVVLVANKDVGEATISKKDAKAIFLGKRSQWGDGKPLTIVIQKSGDVHSAFTKEFTKKSKSQFKGYWGKLVFTGRAKQPKTAKSDDAVISFVSRTAGSVGYVDEGSVTDDVKVLEVK